jgi:hypothetical protein
MSTPHFLLGRLMATPGALNAFAATGENPVNYIVRHMNPDPARSGPRTNCRTYGPCPMAGACSRSKNYGTALASGCLDP